MKRLAFILLALCLFPFFTQRAAALPRDAVSAESAVLIDADTGQVLFDKNMHRRREPASTTKIMTALLTLENCSPQDMAEVTEAAVQIPRNTSHVALTPGEVLPVDSALWALMLPSANDAANVLAEHVAGSQAAFAQLMTQRAKELGALDTSFANAHGLHDAQHYTTAYDLALITRAAVRLPDFLAYFGTGRHTIPPTNKQAEARPFTNQQFMLLPEMWVYNPDVIGGKVGYTQEARHTMSTAATREGRTLICVVLSCGIDEKFYDTQTLLDYGFGSLTKVEIPPENLPARTAPVFTAEEAVGEAAFSLREPLSVLLPAGLTEKDIAYEFTLPQRIEKDAVLSAAVTLTLKTSADDGTPALLMEVPLATSITYTALSPSVKEEQEPSLPKIPRFLRWPLRLITLLLILIVLRRIKILWRRAKRARRRERILRERMG